MAESDGATVSITGSSLGGTLKGMLEADDIQPGSDVSYQLAKDIYLYHPLGAKMVDSPVTMAQSEPREITIQDAPEEVVQAFQKQWEAIGADDHIANVTKLSRIYGLASIVMGCEEVPAKDALDMTKIWNQQIFFNVLDPLNTAGSLVLNQNPSAASFNKPVRVSIGGETYHRSRYEVLMNEGPIFLAYTSSAFGFVGRSVYQRALYPLKSFIRTMITDDMVATKAGLIVAKQKQVSSVVDKVMMRLAGIKRAFIKFGRSGEVLTIGVDEAIETLDMQNIDGAGKFARDNIIKNIATAADMPAQLLNNETMTEGFGEGTEDAKAIIRYVNSMRRKMQSLYAWFDNIVRYRAWNPEFYARIQRKYPQYAAMSYEEAFSEWRAGFTAAWPSLLMEPESEQVKVETAKFETVIAYIQTYLDKLDPTNQRILLEWGAETVSENKLLFPRELQFDWDEFQAFQQEEQARQRENEQKQLELLAQGGTSGEEGDGPGAEKEPTGVAKKVGRFDSAGGPPVLHRLRSAVAKIPPRKTTLRVM